MHLTDANFLFESNEITLERRCRKYWDKYLEALAENEDGELLIREAALNIHRESWLDVEYTIQGLHRSKRLVKYTPILVRILRWCAGIPIDDSGPNYDIEEFLSLALFPETFWYTPISSRSPHTLYSFLFFFCIYTLTCYVAIVCELDLGRGVSLAPSNVLEERDKLDHIHGCEHPPSIGHYRRVSCSHMFSLAILSISTYIQVFITL